MRSHMPGHSAMSVVGIARHAHRARSARVAAPVLLATLLALYLVVLWPWMQQWGTTPAERLRPLPGDALVADANVQSTRAILVRAPAAEVWRWLVQIGEDRAGFYSYTWLENLFGARIRNADRVHPEWQTLRAGDLVRAVPPGYLGDALDPPGWRVSAIEPGRWFVLGGWGVFLVEPTGAATSRVIVRTRFRDDTWWGPAVTRLAFGPVHFVMERRMLQGIRDRAEGRAPGGIGYALAGTGFAVAVVGTAVLLARHRRPLVVGAAPSLLAVAVLRGTGDMTAAAAGFVALGLTELGVGLLPHRWPIVIAVPAAVLLVLLLAPDAYLAFGTVFLGCAAAWNARRGLRSRPRREAPRMPDTAVGDSPARVQASTDGCRAAVGPSSLRPPHAGPPSPVASSATATSTPVIGPPPAT
jgi:hypothetical protein